MITLLQGDCLDILPTIDPVAAVITDPVWPNAPGGMFDGVTDPAALIHDALEMIEAKRVVIVLRYDSDPRFLAAVPTRWPFFRTQTFEYAVPGYNGRKLGGVEVAYCFGEPVPSQPGRRVIPGKGPTVTKPTPVNGHPCPRAVEHFRWLVNWWSDPGETVLDPFMGSGTTGIGCYQLGRNFIGIEKNPDYYAIAESRFIDANTRPTLPEFDRYGMYVDIPVRG